MAVKLFTIDRISVTTTATQISSTVIRTPGIVLSAPASNTTGVIYGDSNVTSTRGGVLLPAESISITCPIIGGHDEELDISDLYVITSTATQ